jgi:hypothetical protein
METATKLNLNSLAAPISEAMANQLDDGRWQAVVMHHHPPHQIKEPGVNMHYSTTLPEIFDTEDEALLFASQFDSQLKARTHVKNVLGKKGFHD